MILSTGQFLLGLFGLMAVLVAHTGALFYWGGQLKRLVLTHDKEIETLREWRHDEVSQDLTALKLAVELLGQTTGHLRKQLDQLEAR